MLFLLIYIFTLILVSYNIYELIKANKLNNDLLFLLSTNYLLNISTALFFGYYNNLIISLISASMLLVFSVILLFAIKKVWGCFKITMIPYTYLTCFVFFYILFYTI